MNCRQAGIPEVAVHTPELTVSIKIVSHDLDQAVSPVHCPEKTTTGCCLILYNIQNMMNVSLELLTHFSQNILFVFFPYLHTVNFAYNGHLGTGKNRPLYRVSVIQKIYYQP